MTQTTRLKLPAGVFVILALAATYWLLHETGVLTTILNGAALREHITRLGAPGPPMVIGLMVLAILVRPIPSAPVAMAAGAASCLVFCSIEAAYTGYRHSAGAMYVVRSRKVSRRCVSA